MKVLRGRFGKGSGYVILIFCWFTWAFCAVSNVIMVVTLPLIEIDFQLTHAMVAVPLFIMSLGASLMRLPAGVLSSKVGLKRMFLLSLILMSLFSVIMGFVSNFLQLIVVSIFLGLGSGIYLPIGTTLLSRHFPRESHGKVFGVHETAVSGGAIIGSLTVSFIVEKMGWRASYVIFAIPGFILAFAFSCLMKEEPEEGFTETGFREILKNKALIVFLIPLTLNSFCSRALGMVPLYLVSVHSISASTAALIVAISRIGGMFTVVGGTLSDKIGRVRMLLTLLTVTFLSMLALAVLPFGVSLIFALFSLTLSGLTYFAVNFAFISDMVPPRSFAATIGLFGTVSAVLGGFSPTVIGLIADVYDFRNAFLFLMAPAFFGILALLTALRRMR